DPLQLGRRRVQVAHERRQGHVDDRRVEVDDERREYQRDEDRRLVSHLPTVLSHRYYLGDSTTAVGDVAEELSRSSRRLTCRHACTATRGPRTIPSAHAACATCSRCARTAVSAMSAASTSTTACPQRSSFMALSTASSSSAARRRSRRTAR